MISLISEKGGNVLMPPLYHFAIPRRGRQSSAVCIGGPRRAILRDGGIGGFEHSQVGRVFDGTRAVNHIRLECLQRECPVFGGAENKFWWAIGNFAYEATRRRRRLLRS